MKLEILTIGDEILSGNITDTNFTWLGEKLWSRGFELHWHTTVGDEPETIRSALMAAIGRSEAVIVTGGLGPTTDDITLEVAAQTFGLSLVLNEQALKDIEVRFQKISRPMTPNNTKQAMLPEGSHMIPNPVGTAPGCHLVFRGVHFFFLPGVPREMKAQFDEEVLPRLVALLPPKINFSQKVLRCFGLPEATIGQKLEGIDLYKPQSGVEGEAPSALPMEGATRAPTIDLAYRLFFPEILLKISGRGGDKADIEKRLMGVEAEIRARLGDIVYAEGDEMLPAVVGRLLTEKKATLATAESCTGGLLSSLITDVPGSSRYFERSVVTYSNDAKAELLDVPMQTILQHGAVSAETAIAMAQGMRRLAGTTYALAVTGIAGSLQGLASPPPSAKPHGASPSTSLRDCSTSKPIGTVHIALDSAQGTEEMKFHFPTNREWFKRVAAFAALDLLRKKLAT